MKKRVCEYCGQKYDPTGLRCPHCGGPNPRAETSRPAAEAAADGETQGKRGVKKPATIAELRDFAVEHRLPLAKMRVHLGEDYRGARAYGVYQAENGDFVVYKNKADGSRAVRYQGPDEARAVGELYDKMKELVIQQRSYQSALRGQTRSGGGGGGSGGSGGSAGSRIGGFLSRHALLITVIAVVLLLVFLFRDRDPKRGYYSYNDDSYYYQNGSWYIYENDSWIPAAADAILSGNYDDYYDAGSWSNGSGVQDFAQSGYYDSDDNGGWWNNNDDNGGGWNDDDDDDGWDWDWDDDDWDWGDDDWDDIGGWDDDW